MKQEAALQEKTDIGMSKSQEYKSMLAEVLFQLKKNITIRQCCDKDIIRIGQFYDDVILWMNNHVNYPQWIYKVYPAESSVRTMVKTGAQYICENRETILAAFALDTSPQGNYQKGNWSRFLMDGTYMVIHALAIDFRKQRQGIGTEVIRFCVEKAKAENCKAVRVDIVPSNYPARRLFEKNGFVYAGDFDLELSVGGIPAFSLYELNF